VRRAGSVGRRWHSGTGAGDRRDPPGIERLRRRDPARVGVFEAWLSTLLHDCADRILPVTAEVAEEWGRLNVPDPFR
jgi:hypothetical protein